MSIGPDWASTVVFLLAATLAVGTLMRFVRELRHPRPDDYQLNWNAESCPER